jgi:predicted TIM-barrel fold metal-dependent hydrolase
MAASLAGAGLAGASAPLWAHSAPEDNEDEQGPKTIDSHVHLWKLPRNAPPMSDNATFPTGCCGSVPWMEVDRLIPDYNARVGGPKVDKVVLIESSVGVPADKIIQSNVWMLQTAATEKKILSVIGNLDVTESPTTFAQQVSQLAANKQWIGIRIGGSIFQSGVPASFATIKPNVMTNLTLLATRGLQIDTLGISGAVLSQIGAAIRGLTIVMDHFAGKPTTFDVEDAWKADMMAAVNYAGLYIKVSDVHKLSSQAVTGQPAGLTQFQPIADASRYAPTVEFLLNLFGADRLIFGTNWPVSDAGGIFVDSIDLELQIMENILGDQHGGARDKVMYENAARVYSPRH